jgi:hypothetical protein
MPKKLRKYDPIPRDRDIIPRWDQISHEISLGGDGEYGAIILKRPDGRDALVLTGGGNIFAGDNDEAGNVVIKDPEGNEIISVNWHSGIIVVGGNGKHGGITLRNKQGKQTIDLNGDGSSLVMRDQNGQVIITIDGNDGAIALGGSGKYGSMSLRDLKGRENLLLNGGGNIFAGGNNESGDIVIRNGAGAETVRINGQVGDILLAGADCAEEFDAVNVEKLSPGTVVSIDTLGRLTECSIPYDKRVAGVVSGGGGWSPGIVLGKTAGRDKVPVAFAGKVFCRVDAAYGPVDTGDLLTRSSTPGYAMKMSEPGRALGAILGKALRRLESGRDLVPIIVALQ